MGRTQQTGQSGEKLAAELLKKKGFEILATNWKCRHLELDIVALDGKNLVFVEVKTRSSLGAGEPESFVTRLKQRNLIRAANLYYEAHPSELEARFDIVAVFFGPDGARVEHLADAFYPLA